MDCITDRDRIHAAEQLIRLFNDAFGEQYNTRLRGGFEEPVYLPAAGEQAAEIRFREDYYSSALHEIAHWCIAGSERRQQQDYGYWYEADGRSPEQQLAFYQVEVKPQALEWCFSVVAGYEFRVSTDNLTGVTGVNEWQIWECMNQQQKDFHTACLSQIMQWFERGFPERGRLFIDSLMEHYQIVETFNPQLFGSYS